MKYRTIILLAALLALPAWAQPAAVVESVQAPAWLERDGRQAPLAVGTELRSGDAIRTGLGARALVKLAEGSTLKMGENGALRISDIQPQKDGFFRAALRVVQGAFRFTTDALAKARRRDVSIAVGTVTAGIRGTDLWGKSDTDRQIVCLIEGKIEVGAEGEQPVTMDQAHQFYRREKGQTQPVGFVTPALLGEWARETEVEAGKGAMRRGGKWHVTLASPANRQAALALHDQVRAEGYAAEIRPAKSNEQRVYHVRISSLPSKEEAEALAARLRGRHGIVEPKVSI